MKREWNRLTKIRQLVEKQPIKAELAAQWWASNGNYEQYATLVFVGADSYRQAWVLEHAYIGLWQPHLIHPYITKFLKYKSHRLILTKKAQTTSRVSLGFRLLRKVRIRMQAQYKTKHVAALTSHRGFDLLWQLSSATQQSFDAQRFLRSNNFTNDEVYALCRLCNHLEQPHRSQCMGELRKIMQFRNMTFPLSTCPLTISALSHPEFFGMCKKWLRQYILEHKSSCIPFHLPIRESAHSSFHQLLWNHKKIHPMCRCVQIRNQFSGLPTTGGHVFASAEQIAAQIPGDLGVHLLYNSRTPVFPNQEQYFQKAEQQFIRWSKRHGIPLHWVSEFRVFVSSQWQLHLAHVERTRHCDASSSLLTMKKAMFLKKHVLKDFVIHCQDHQPGHFMMFCPCLYYESSVRTWNAPDIFEQLEGSTEFHRQTTLQAIPAWVRKEYQWGLDTSASLPYGYVLLKRKKQFLVGRTIVAYRGTILAKLLTGAALVLKQLLTTGWGFSFGGSATPIMWRKIHKVFAETPIQESLFFHNDDLVGFFNRIPQERLLAMVEAMLREFQSKHPAPCVMVDVHGSIKTSAVHLGFSKQSSHANFKRLWLEHLVPLVQLSFECGRFTAVGNTYRQIRGTCMGNQISPILSEIAVAAVEVAWSRAWSSQFVGHRIFHCWRYVDNRVLLMSQSSKAHSAVQSFLHSDFYGPPVQLELVEDNHFLGFEVVPESRQIKYILPEERWQIRNPSSSCSLNLLMSGLRSRLALIIKYTFPCYDIVPMTLQLGNFFEKHGYDPNEIEHVRRIAICSLRRQVVHQCTKAAPCLLCQ